MSLYIVCIVYLKGHTLNMVRDLKGQFQPHCHNHAEKDPTVDKSSDPTEMGVGVHVLTHCKGSVSTFVSVSVAFPFAYSELSHLRGDEVQLLHFDLISDSNCWSC